MFRPGLGFGQRYHVDRHGQLTLKQLRLSVLNEMHTNSYTGPRLMRSRYHPTYLVQILEADIKKIPEFSHLVWQVVYLTIITQIQVP